MKTDTEKSIVLSGIRATGSMHLGNYLGAVRHFVELASPDRECFYFVANFHSLTTPTEPGQLQIDVREITLDFLAAGLDPNESTIYAQSSIPEIAELSWLLACVTPVSGLMSMPHFKEKREQLEEERETVNAGLLTYPVLMTADILGPRAQLVPVGQDQHAHVELAREIARRFNRTYGELFPVPELMEGPGIRVPNLATPGRKMEKSARGNGCIYMTDSAASVGDKVRRAVTDPARQRREDPGDPEVCPIFALHRLLSTGDELAWASTGCRNAGIGCIECKRVLTDHIVGLLDPFQERRQQLVARGPDFVDEVLHEGGKRARTRITDTVEHAKELAGVPGY